MKRIFAKPSAPVDPWARRPPASWTAAGLTLTRGTNGKGLGLRSGIRPQRPWHSISNCGMSLTGWRRLAVPTNQSASYRTSSRSFRHQPSGRRGNRRMPGWPAIQLHGSRTGRVRCANTLGLRTRSQAPDFVAAISSYGRSQLCGGASQRLGQDQGDSLRRRRGVPGGEAAPSSPTSTEFLCVARLSGQKGLPLLIGACAALHQAGERILSLTIVGDGELRGELQVRTFSRQGLSERDFRRSALLNGNPRIFIQGLEPSFSRASRRASR